MFTQDSRSTRSSFQKELQMILTAELMKTSRKQAQAQAVLPAAAWKRWNIEPSRKQAQAVLPAAAWK